MSASARVARFDPAGPLRGGLIPPPDKSVSHRAALLAAMCSEPVRIGNFLHAEDTQRTLEVVRALGALVEEHADGVVVRGTGLREAAEVDGPIDVGNAGTLMRLLPGWLASQNGRSWTIDGDDSIRRRPVDRIADPLAAMGARLEATGGRFPPFTVYGGALRGISYELPQASAQVKSCVLLAGLTADGTTTVIEPAPSRDHTERMLARAGCRIDRAENRVTVGNCDELELEQVDVPGDLSSAAFLIAAGLLVRGSRLLLEGVGVNRTRAGFLRIVERMGGVVVGELENGGPRVEDAASADGPEDNPVASAGGPTRGGEPVSTDEPVSDLDVAASPLVGTEVEATEVAEAIDELPLVALLGCYAEGETVVRGARELRVKESDRIAGVVEGLRGLGADIEGFEDGFVVCGTGGLQGGHIDARGDHRLAMLGAVAGLASREGVEVAGMQAAAVSYPRFVEDLGRLVHRG